MPHHAEQLELPFPGLPRTVACVSSMHRMTSIPTASTTPPPYCPPRELRPDYDDVDDAPTTVIQEAHRERYAWIRRYVHSGRGPRWKLSASAIAHARIMGVGPSAAPPLEDLEKWVKQYRWDGFRGLLRRPR